MNIQKTILEQILNEQPDLPPESGGIIGGSDSAVTIHFKDDGITGGRTCCYQPNIVLLNDVIQQWQAKDLEFMGIYHSHFFGVKTLSEGDKTYIKIILQNMPDFINYLYFPVVVMPDKELVCYKAFINSGEVIIKPEKLVVI